MGESRTLYHSTSSRYRALPLRELVPAGVKGMDLPTRSATDRNASFVIAGGAALTKSAHALFVNPFKTVFLAIFGLTAILVLPFLALRAICESFQAKIQALSVVTRGVEWVCCALLRGSEWLLTGTFDQLAARDARIDAGKLSV